MKIKRILAALLIMLLLVGTTACSSRVSVPFLHNSNVCITDSREAIISGLRLSYVSDIGVYETPGSVTIAGVEFEGAEVEFIGSILDYVIYFIDGPNDGDFDTVFGHLTSLFGRPAEQQRTTYAWPVVQDDVAFLVTLSFFEGFELSSGAVIEPSLYLTMALQ